MKLVGGAATLAAILYSLIVWAPHWTARFEEHRRAALFQQATHQAVNEALPNCPPTGPDRDSFLEAREREIVQPGLWKPVCRITPLPTGKVIVIASDRDTFTTCRERHLWTPTNFRCALDEPLRFLDDPTQRRTWARQQAPDKLNQQCIWITSQRLAWQEQLALEHQIRVCLLIAGTVSCLLAIGFVLRCRLAVQLRAAGRVEGEPAPPYFAELLFHWFIGKRSPRMTNEFSQDYVLKREQGWTKKEADRFYRLQVIHSLFPFLRMHLGDLIHRGGPWTFPDNH